MVTRNNIGDSMYLCYTPLYMVTRNNIGDMMYPCYTPLVNGH